MTVSGISRYKGDTYCIEFAESDEKVYVHENIIYDFHLRKGLVLSEENFTDIKHAQMFRKARERALYFLDNREYGFVEMYEKLERDYDDDICMEVCKDLAASSLINDRRYAENLARHYCLTKRFGFFRAKQEMMKKGISSAIAEEYLGEYEDTAEERLTEIFEGKYLRGINSPKALNKARSALARYGYSYSQISGMLKMYDIGFEDTEDYFS